MKSVLVWDFPTRLFHWLLVVAIAAAYISGDTGGNWMVWHGRIGILIVGLIAGILGGIVGTGTSIMLLPVLACHLNYLVAFGPGFVSERAKQARGRQSKLDRAKESSTRR